MSVHLLSSDSEEFKVDKEVAERSVLIKNMLEGKKIKSAENNQREKSRLKTRIFLILDIGDSDAPIPLPNVTSKVLGKVKYTLLLNRFYT